MFFFLMTTLLVHTDVKLRILVFRVGHNKKQIHLVRINIIEEFEKIIKYVQNVIGSFKSAPHEKRIETS